MSPEALEAGPSKMEASKAFIPPASTDTHTPRVKRHATIQTPYEPPRAQLTKPSEVVYPSTPHRRRGIAPRSFTERSKPGLTPLITAASSNVRKRKSSGSYIDNGSPHGRRKRLPTDIDLSRPLPPPHSPADDPLLLSADPVRQVVKRVRKRIKYVRKSRNGRSFGSIETAVSSDPKGKGKETGEWSPHEGSEYDENLYDVTNIETIADEGPSVLFAPNLPTQLENEDEGIGENGVLEFAEVQEQILDNLTSEISQEAGSHVEDEFHGRALSVARQNGPSETDDNSREQRPKHGLQAFLESTLGERSPTLPILSSPSLPLSPRFEEPVSPSPRGPDIPASPLLKSNPKYSPSLPPSSPQLGEPILPSFLETNISIPSTTLPAKGDIEPNSLSTAPSRSPSSPIRDIASRDNALSALFPLPQMHDDVDAISEHQSSPHVSHHTFSAFSSPSPSPIPEVIWPETSSPLARIVPLPSPQRSISPLGTRDLPSTPIAFPPSSSFFSSPVRDETRLPPSSAPASPDILHERDIDASSPSGTPDFAREATDILDLVDALPETLCAPLSSPLHPSQSISPADAPPSPRKTSNEVSLGSASQVEVHSTLASPEAARCTSESEDTHPDNLNITELAQAVPVDHFVLSTNENLDIGKESRLPLSHPTLVQFPNQLHTPAESFLSVSVGFLRRRSSVTTNTGSSLRIADETQRPVDQFIPNASTTSSEVSVPCPPVDISSVENPTSRNLATNEIESRTGAPLADPSSTPPQDDVPLRLSFAFQRESVLSSLEVSKPSFGHHYHSSSSIALPTVPQQDIEPQDHQSRAIHLKENGLAAYFDFSSIREPPSEEPAFEDVGGLHEPGFDMHEFSTQTHFEEVTRDERGISPLQSSVRGFPSEMAFPSLSSYRASPAPARSSSSTVSSPLQEPQLPVFSLSSPDRPILDTRSSRGRPVAAKISDGWSSDPLDQPVNISDPDASDGDEIEQDLVVPMSDNHGPDTSSPPAFSSETTEISTGNRTHWKAPRAPSPFIRNISTGEHNEGDTSSEDDLTDRDVGRGPATPLDSSRNITPVSTVRVGSTTKSTVGGSVEVVAFAHPSHEALYIPSAHSQTPKIEEADTPVPSPQSPRIEMVATKHVMVQENVECLSNYVTQAAQNDISPTSRSHSVPASDEGFVDGSLAGGDDSDLIGDEYGISQPVASTASLGFSHGSSNAPLASPPPISIVASNPGRIRNENHAELPSRSDLSTHVDSLIVGTTPHFSDVANISNDIKRGQSVEWEGQGSDIKQGMVNHADNESEGQYDLEEGELSVISKDPQAAARVAVILADTDFEVVARSPSQSRSRSYSPNKKRAVVTFSPTKNHAWRRSVELPSFNLDASFLHGSNDHSFAFSEPPSMLDFESGNTTITASGRRRPRGPPIPTPLAEPRAWTRNDWKVLDACFTNERVAKGSGTSSGISFNLEDADGVDLDAVVARFLDAVDAPSNTGEFGPDWIRANLRKRAKALLNKQRSGRGVPPTPALSFRKEADIDEYADSVNLDETMLNLSPLVGRGNFSPRPANHFVPKASSTLKNGVSVQNAPASPPTKSRYSQLLDEAISVNTNEKSVTSSKTSPAIKPSIPIARTATWQRNPGSKSFIPTLVKHRSGLPVRSNKKPPPRGGVPLPLPPPEILSKSRRSIHTPVRIPSTSRPLKDVFELHPPTSSAKRSRIPQARNPPQRLVELNHVSPPPSSPPRHVPVSLLGKKRSGRTSVNDLVKGYEELDRRTSMESLRSAAQSRMSNHSRVADLQTGPGAQRPTWKS